jgi:hypothetical protein
MKPSDQKWNHQIKNMSISIDNGTLNRKHRNHEWTYMQHVHNQMSDQQSNMNITTPYAHTITTYDSTTKFGSQQVSITTANLPASLLATIVSARWWLRVETEVIYIGLCYWTMLGLSVIGPSVNNRNSDEIFREKTVDTCIRRNKATIIFIFVSTNVFLFSYNFQLLPFPVHCFSYFWNEARSIENFRNCFHPYLEAYLMWLFGFVLFCGSQREAAPKHLIPYAQSITDAPTTMYPRSNGSSFCWRARTGGYAPALEGGLHSPHLGWFLDVAAVVIVQAIPRGPLENQPLTVPTDRQYMRATTT